jgi:hypothetical protein
MAGLTSIIVFGVLVASTILGLCCADNDNMTVEAEWVEDTEEQEGAEKHLARVVMVGILTCVAALLLAHYLTHTMEIKLMPEAAVFMLVGMVVGLLIDFNDRGLFILTQFDTNFFFVGLLPPIIFNAGYSMKRYVCCS